MRKWRYTPTLLDGNAVPVIMTVSVNFKGSGQLAIGELRKALKSPNEHIRESAARWLGQARTGSGFDAEELARVMRELEQLSTADPSERVRAAATRSLAQLGPK